ncbi:MAG: dehydrogenase [Firmicutes bacterium HGW-Firmicutes-14]|nr:MAG: dehydrogenase [Firmicutes bacterium HGW-Firmicutes-14]
MEIAIMGAGLSGLSCAITLAQNGITPVVFENRSRPGDRFINAEILLDILNRPVMDSLAYLSGNHGIFLQPSSNIRRLILISENRRAVIEGNLGFVTIRGRHTQSFESQLAGRYSGKIVFNSRESYEDLIQEFSHVIMATGDAAYAVRLRNYEEDLTVRLKGATFTGNFDPQTVYAWLDYRIAPRGYCYLIPFSREEANGVIAYPEYPDTLSTNPAVLWSRFEARLEEEFSGGLRVTDTFDVQGYIIGSATTPRIGNTFFTGNCLCAVMPFLGFGQFTAILSGIYAARDLLGMGDYLGLTAKIRKSYRKSLVMRRFLENLDNQGLDTLVSALSGGLGNRIFNSRFNLLSTVSLILKPWVLKDEVIKTR